MNVVIDQLAKAIAERVRPEIPLSIALWDAGMIAAYLTVSRRKVLEHYAAMPGFPQAIRLPSGRPSGKSVKSHPRWKAEEIIGWAEKLQERRVA